MDRIRIHTNWTNTVQEVHEYALEELVDGAVRERLKQAFTDPEAFRPVKTRQALTEETASEFAGIAQRLRDRGNEAHQVAHFVNRLVFCMFAEDFGLLPDSLFTKMLEVSRRDPDGFAENARTLFGAMAHKGGKVGFTSIDWFNGLGGGNEMKQPAGRKAVKWIIGFAFAGWAAVIALAYSLAGERIKVCETPACILRARAAHDNILVLGLFVALAAAVAIAFKYAPELSQMSWRRSSRWRPSAWGEAEPICLPDERDL